MRVLLILRSTLNRGKRLKKSFGFSNLDIDNLVAISNPWFKVNERCLAQRFVLIKCYKQKSLGINRGFL